ncbi:MAG: substrate-binding domain-containing protein [Fimbriimonadaceae bacterium]
MNSKWKLGRLAALFAVLAAVSVWTLAGCGSKSEAPGAEGTVRGAGAQSDGRTSLRIAMIAKSSTNPVFVSAHEGARAAARELSASEGFSVTVEILTPGTEDAQRQAQAIAEAVNNGFDAILISCSDAAKVTGAIDEAVAKGVAVMTFDSDAPDSRRFAFYGADDIAVGTQVMQELGRMIPADLDRKFNVAILAGNQNAPNLQKRVRGVLDEAAKNPRVRIVGTFYHNETAQDATAEVLRAMRANPEIDGWAMVGGWPLFAPGLLREIDPNRTKIVAVDALPAQLAYVDRGVAPVLLAQPTYLWGKIGVETIFRKLVKGEAVEAVNKMDLVRVDRSNLGEWAAQLRDWGFEGIDPKFLSR